LAEHLTVDALDLGQGLKLKRRDVTKLHQILAVAQGTKQRAQTALTKFYHQVQKPEPFSGLVKQYTPKDDEGEQLPSEGVRVQLNAHALLQDLKEQLRPMYKVVGDIDRTNSMAAADIIIAGKVILANVPVATLLWMEKQLADMRTVFASVPQLNPEYVWTLDDATGNWTTAEQHTSRSKKIPRNHVKAKATDKHPEQVEVYFEDVIVGTWTKRGLSGAMRAADIRAYSERLETLRDAVKDARERANSVDVQPFDTSPVLDYLFKG
jgi:hypothetical protein